MKNIILLGGGGHCKSCIQVIEEHGEYSIHGILDMPDAVGNTILGYEVIGTDDLVTRLDKDSYEYLITLGQIQDPTTRIALFNFLHSVNAILATIVARTAVISRHATIGKGSVIMNHTLVSSDCRIGANCIVNNFANIEHDTVIGDHCHVSTGAMVNGNVRIGNETFVGSGAVLIQGISICDRVVVGAGSVVTKAITEPGVYAGSPADLIRRF